MRWIYHYVSYNLPYEIACDSLEEAFGIALVDMDTGNAWPMSIEEEGSPSPLWEQEGPLKTHQSLVKCAKSNGLHVDRYA